jgi:muramoyltetrapeptide carboxypeptidase
MVTHTALNVMAERGTDTLGQRSECTCRILEARGQFYGMLLHPPRTIPNLCKPLRLQRGDSVLVIAPASPPSSQDVVARASAYLTDAGFQVVIGAHARERNGFLAGLDSQRLADISEAFASPVVRAVFCLRGGYGSGRILNAIPFQELNKHPKIFVGSSDLTSILCGCALDGQVISFHGPTLESLLGDSCQKFTSTSLMQMITGQPGAVGSIRNGYQCTIPVESLSPGVATGRLVGGNLTLLASLIGTRFFPCLDDSILFLEDVAEAPYRIDRLLTQLLNIGALQRVRGFALGLFERCEYGPNDAPNRQSLRDVMVERLAPLGKPIVVGLPFGHTPFNATIPVGALATLNADVADLIIEEMPVA